MSVSDQIDEQPIGDDVETAEPAEAVDQDEAVIEGASEAETVVETEEATPVDPLEEFREALRAKPGDWFAIHTYAGMENRVKLNLENRVTSLNMEAYIHEIVVPTEEVAEIKNGQRKVRTKPSLPGYVLVRMYMTDETWRAVSDTPGVTGFVGPRQRLPRRCQPAALGQGRSRSSRG